MQYERTTIPFENGTLNCIRIPAKDTKSSLLVCGGYDSFIEEFVLQVLPFVEQGYTVIMFEGPGQGLCLQQEMHFRHDFEKATSAVIEYFRLESCAMVGISWGGYFALRSAAFDNRIYAAVAYDVLDDGSEVMMNVFPKPLRNLFQYAIKHNKKVLINTLCCFLMKRNLLADWGISQGMYITGTKTPYEMYQNIRKHSMAKISGRLIQHILLLAGEEDHYIPQTQYFRLKKSIHNAKTLTCRMFTKAEGGEHHCQAGNHMLAVNEILNWLDRLHLH